MWGRTPYQHPGKWLGSGNRCGHDPKRGEFDRYAAPQTKRLPKVMAQLLEGAREYYHAPAILPTLSNLNGKANADGSPRQNRSEGRAAESLVLSAIINHLEFSTLRVGTPKPDGSFVPRSCGELAKVAGLEAPDSDPDYPQPSQRFWRAFRRLKLAGAFTVHKQYETKPDGSKRARPAIKAVSMQFLVCLGKVGYQKLKEFRTWATNRLKKVRRKHREQSPEAHDAAQARHRVATRQAAATGVQAVMPKRRRGSRAGLDDADPEKQALAQYNKQVNDYFYELAVNNPGATAEQIRQLVRIKFPPYEEWRDRQ